MSKARKNTSRALELNIVGNIFNNDEDSFIRYLKNNPLGGTYNSSGVKFHFGKIERLIPFLSSDSELNIGINNINEVYHIDTVSKETKKALVKRLNLKKDEMNKNVDLLILCEERLPYLISVKDSKKVAKLGQQSTERKYHDVVLKGGILVDFEKEDINIKECNDIKHEETLLTQEQFDKLSDKDKIYAYLKVNFKSKWKKSVEKNYENAYSQLKNLGIKMREDKQTFITFLKIVLTGTEYVSDYIYIYISGKLIRLSSFFEVLIKTDYYISISDYSTINKKSLVIEIEIAGVKYGITKIEPSFDGAKANVSQTKGIIYYFQEFMSLDKKNIWDLINFIND